MKTIDDVLTQGQNSGGGSLSDLNDIALQRCNTNTDRTTHNLGDDSQKCSMLKLFAKYSAIGIVNTVIHWGIFVLCVYGWNSSQAVANLTGFILTASFSFFANARFTFQSQATGGRYLLFLGFMGLLSLANGWLADQLVLPPVLTLVTTSLLSLLLGFIYTKQVIFRR